MHGGHSHSHSHAMPLEGEGSKVPKRVQFRYVCAGALFVLGTRAAVGVEQLRPVFLFAAVALVAYDPAIRFATGLRDGVGGLLMGWRRHRSLALRYSTQEFRGSGKSSHAAADRITVLGIWVNVGLALGKCVAGTLGNSAALLADAGHSLSDLVSDFVTLGTLRMSRLPPDADHPYGHGRFEQLGSLFVALMLLLTGWHFGGALSLEQLFGPTAAVAHGGHVHAQAQAAWDFTWLAMSVATFSIVAKELLFQATARVAKRINSPVLIANAWHHRSDALSSVVALIGIAGAKLGCPMLDPIAGFIVAGMVMLAGLQVGSDALKQLTDTAEPELVGRVNKGVASIPGLWEEDGAPLGLRYSNVRARRMGPQTHVDLTVTAKKSMSTATAASVVEKIKKGIIAMEPSVTEVLVNLETKDKSGSGSMAPAPDALADEAVLYEEAREALAKVLGERQSEEPDLSVSVKDVEIDFEEGLPVVVLTLASPAADVSDAGRSGAPQESSGTELASLRELAQQLKKEVVERRPEMMVRVTLVLLDDAPPSPAGRSSREAKVDAEERHGHDMDHSHDHGDDTSHSHEDSRDISVSLGDSAEAR